jgi:hypothetical protein
VGRSAIPRSGRLPGSTIIDDGDPTDRGCERKHAGLPPIVRVLHQERRELREGDDLIIGSELATFDPWRVQHGLDTAVLYGAAA